MSRDRDGRILVLMPRGADADLAGTVTREAALPATLCEDPAHLGRELQAGAGLVLLAEESLGGDGAANVAEVLRRQPSWSDVPVIAVGSNGATTGSGLAHLHRLKPLGNVTLLERPVSLVTLLSAIATGLRARRRQYQLRDHLEERACSEAERERLLTGEQAARAEVEAAARAKDEFLAVLSHELRTPLQSMISWVKVLQAENLDAATWRRALETIQRSVKMQAQLIEDLLDLSRIIAGKMRVELRPVKAAAAVAAAVEAASASAAQKRVLLETAIHAGEVEVAADPNRLQQIVWNLLSNAVKFSKEGDRVAVTVEQAARDVVISVRDDGVGIDPAVLPRIFERFHQGDSSSTRAHGGLGLGLAIVRHLVQLHGGSVAAESAGPGRGAVFTVRLPTLPPRPATAPRVSRVEGGAPLRERRVLRGLHLLVVDDDVDALDALTTVLRGEGAVVTAARSVRAALAVLDRERPDVIVSDISMPGEDGYDLVRQLRQRDPGSAHIPALALTAHARPDDTERAFRAGFDAHVAKPVDLAHLAQAIAKLAGRFAA